MFAKTVLLCFLACIAYSAAETDAEVKQTQANFIFDSLDSDNDGKISLTEAKAFYKKFGLSNKQIAELFDKMDVNDDQVVTKEEFTKYASNIPVRTGEDLLKGTFDKIDSDNDGFITLDEVKKFYLQFGSKAADIEKWFKVVDKDGNSKLCYEEFKKNALSS